MVRNAFLRFAVTSAVALFSFSAFAQSPSTCKDLFGNGLYDTNRLKTNQSEQMALLRNFCLSSETSLKNYAKTTVGLTYEGATGDFSQKDTKDISEKLSLCSNLSDFSKRSSMYERVVSVIPSNAPEIIRACKAGGSGSGIFLWVEKDTLSTVNGELGFSVRIFYKRGFSNPNSVTAILKIDGGACNFDSSNKLQATVQLLEQTEPKTFRCRTDREAKIYFESSDQIAGSQPAEIITVLALTPKATTSAVYSASLPPKGGDTVNTIIPIKEPGWYRVEVIGRNEAFMEPGNHRREVHVHVRVNGEIPDGCKGMRTSGDGLQGLDHQCSVTVFSLSGGEIRVRVDAGHLGGSRNAASIVSAKAEQLSVD